MGGHQLQDEAQTEEDAAAPPASLGEKISRLTNPDERVRRRAGAAEIRGEPGALSALEQNGSHQHEAVDYQQREKKRVNH